MWMQDDLVPGFFFLSITRGSGRWLGGAWVCTLMYPTSFGDYLSLYLVWSPCLLMLLWVKHV